MGIHIMPPLYKMVITPPPIEVIVVIYPDAHPESKSVDGYVWHFSGAFSWAEMVAAAGSNSSDDATVIGVGGFQAATAEGAWLSLTRGIILFDTSELTDEAVKKSATLSLHGDSKVDTLGAAPNINIYSSNPTVNASLQAKDYKTLGSTPYCDTPIAYADWDTAGWNSFELNAAGLAAISKTGITKLGTRNANYDVAGISPTWKASRKRSILVCVSAEGATNKKPKLTITYKI